MPAGISSKPAAESPLTSGLRAQLEAQRQTADWGALAEWMKAPTTIALVDSWLREEGARHEGGPRLVLTLVAMHLHAEQLFDPEAAHDKTMHREARRLCRRLFHTLGLPPRGQGKGAGGGIPADESLAEALRRARRFHTAWSAIDKPACVNFLMTSLVLPSAAGPDGHDVRVRGMDGDVEAGSVAAQEGAAQAAHVALQANDVPPQTDASRHTTDEPSTQRFPEAPRPAAEVFAQIRSIGGAGAEAEARRLHAGQWRRVSAARLHDHVREIAHRAYWDAIREAVGSGDYAPLWSVLSELQKAMKALAGPRTRDEIDDKFDVDWIENRVAHGALETEEVHGLMRFVGSLIASWQAPADDEEVRVWLCSTEAAIAETGVDVPLADFIGAHMIDFVRGAIERVGKVYQRTMDLVTERELSAPPAERTTQDASDAARQE